MNKGSIFIYTSFIFWSILTNNNYIKMIKYKIEIKGEDNT